MHRTIRNSFFLPLAVSAMTACGLSNAYAASIDPPSGALLLDAEASGVQIYECAYDKSRQLKWVFKAPRATLYDASGGVVIEHSAGPTWQANDGSRIKGELITQTPSDAPDSVPQLLLRAKSVGGDGLLANVLYVQRLKTRGGTQPTAACTKEHQMGSSPYIADYRFFK